MNRWAVLVGSLVLFVAACCLPAVEFRKNAAGSVVWFGGEALAMGWLGVLLGQFAWLANPLLVFSGPLLALRLRLPAIACAGLAVLFSLNTFVLFGMEVPGDEAGVNKLYLQALREGAWLWFGSLGVMLTGAFVARWVPVQPRRVVVDDSNFFEKS